MDSKKSVGIWIRVSTEMQVDSESPEHHERRAKLYAEAKGWNVVEVYKLEAISGKSVMNQPETKRMLQDVQSGRITGLIFSKLARLARNTKELLEFAEIFKQHNADLISLAESIDTSTPAGRLFYTMIAAMATWEREEIAERVAASIPIRAQMGKPLSAMSSLGYRWKDKQLIIDEKEAPIRKLVYDLFLKTKRKKTTARMLNDMGYRTRNGAKFGHTTIARLIQDPTAKGIRISNYTTGRVNGNRLKPKDQWVYVPCPAIVDEAIWDECNRIHSEQVTKKAPPGRNAVHLLSGFLLCEECNKKMYVYHKDKQPTFRCKACRTKIEVADIDEIYHEQLKTFLLTDTDINDYLKKFDQELRDKQLLLEVTRSKQENVQKEIKRLVDLRLKDELTTDTFVPLVRPLEQVMKQLNDQIPELEAEIDFYKIQYLSSDTVLSGAKDLYNNWALLSFEERRTIVEAITERITIGKSDINISLSYFPSPTPPSPSPNAGKSDRKECVAIEYQCQGLIDP